MSGSTLGTLFRVTTFGEATARRSAASSTAARRAWRCREADIQPELDRRRPGTSRHVTQRNEADAVEILSGVFEGRTTGTPIALLIRNTDQRSKDYANLLDTFRPGHADYTYQHKYGLRDQRGGGRASARLTAPRSPPAAIARKWLRRALRHHLRRPHDASSATIAIPFEGLEHVGDNPFFAANASDIAALEAYMDELRKAGDCCGARIDVVARGVPVGLGEPIYDKLDADIAHAMMGINAVKGVEIGAGFAAVAQRGTSTRRRAHAGGLRQQQRGRRARRHLDRPGHHGLASRSSPPARSAARAARSTSPARRPTVETHGRHDPCVGIRATPIAEAMLALVLMDHALRHRAQCGDVRVSPPPIPARAP